MKHLTVFTPTYNRAHTLPRLYASLLEQSSDDFEWHIVDDGSTDSTEALVRSWRAEATFPIKYTYQVNSGKAQAHNRGVLESSLDFFICVDSDDFMCPDAVQRITDVLQGCDDPVCVGLLAYKGLSETTPTTAARFSNSTHSSLRHEYRQGFHGDTALVYRTDVLKRFLFPAFPPETFVTEGIVYAQIDHRFRLHVVRDVFVVCEYQAGGLSSNPLKLKRDNPAGFSAYYLVLSETSSGTHALWLLAHSICYSLLLPRQRRPKYNLQWWRLAAAWPAGLLLSLRRRSQYRQLDRIPS